MPTMYPDKSIQSELRALFQGDPDATDYDLWSQVREEYVRRNGFQEWRTLSFFCHFFDAEANPDHARTNALRLHALLVEWSEAVKEAKKSSKARWWPLGRTKQQRRAREHLDQVTKELLSLLTALTISSQRAYREYSETSLTSRQPDSLA